MPSMQSRLAPFFLGDIEDPVEEFLQEYKELANNYHLTSRQKVETVIWYVASSQCDVWKSLKGYVNHNWGDLCCELCDKYVAPTKNGCYSKQKLQELADNTTCAQMRDEGNVLKYYCKFYRLSKPLLDANQITVGEQNATFWNGFHPINCKALCKHLIAKKSDLLRGCAFDFKDVLETMQAIFSDDDDFFFQEQPSQHYKPNCKPE